MTFLDPTDTFLSGNQCGFGLAEIIIDLNLSLLNLNRLDLKFSLSLNREFPLSLSLFLLLNHLFEFLIGSFVFGVQFLLKDCELLLQVDNCSLSLSELIKTHTKMVLLLF
jgi:hypothetical protein